MNKYMEIIMIKLNLLIILDLNYKMNYVHGVINILIIMIMIKLINILINI